MNKKEKYDFGGWATKNNIRCADDRVIIQDAFKDQDGSTVPLVWNHDHKAIEAVLGHALLENRPEGVYAYCTFNNTDKGLKAREMVKNGDIRSLSIYANQLKQDGNNVVHGMIREVSLVLAGANMGAYIDTVIAHSDDHDEESVIYHPYDEEFEMYHADEDKPKEESKPDESGNTVKEVYDSMSDAEKDVVITAAGIVRSGDKEAGLSDEQKSVFDKMSEEKKQVVYYLIGNIADQANSAAAHSDESNEDDEKTEETKTDEVVEHTDLNDDKQENKTTDTEGEEMKTNCFEKSANTNVSAEMIHSAFVEIAAEGQRIGNLRDAYNAFVKKCEASENVTDKELAHSITDISNFYPEYQGVNNVPNVVDRDQTWVGKVMGAVRHVPFSRIKSTAANITADDARAKGYVTGHQKLEEVIVALKRTTSPQTVYKLQKLDRDDVIDITDFDVVVFMKAEMQGKLKEELARAILVGDGRSDAAEDKINPTNIRPILGDNSVYTIAKTMEKENDESEYAFAGRFIDEAIKARKEYKGSGNLTLFCSEDHFANMLLLKDLNGRRIYKTKAELETALMVKEIVTVPVMNDQVRTSAGKDYKLLGIFVNLTDYALGTNKKGGATMFDDFNIEYNKYLYLIETRCSGALHMPYSAITFEEVSDHVNG